MRYFFGAFLFLTATLLLQLATDVKGSPSFPQPVESSLGIKFASPTLPMLPETFDQFEKEDVDYSQLTAVVIGGSTGIGKATVDYLKDVVGFGTVIATSRNPREYPDFRDDVPLLRLDVSKPLSRFFFTRVLRWRCNDNVNLLILNAGRYSIGTPLEAEQDKIDLVQDTNYNGLVEIFKSIEPMMPMGENDYARVGLTSSTSNNFVTIPPSEPGAEVGGLDGFPYYVSKRAQFVFAQALKAQIENANNPASQWPEIRKNLKVFVTFPVSIDTKLAENLILLEDTDFARQLRDQFQATFNNIAIPASVVGEAYGQLAQLKNPPLGNYIYDLACDPTTNLPCALQVFPYSLFLAEAGQSVSVPLPPGQHGVSVPSSSEERTTALRNFNERLAQIERMHPTFNSTRYTKVIASML